MSNKILAVRKNVLTSGLVKDAAKDARKLRQDISWLGDNAVLYGAEQEFDGVISSPHMRITIDEESRDQFRYEAPALLLLLQEIDSIPPAIDGMQGIAGTILRELTINYVDKGTMVSMHRDKNDDPVPKLSRVATLCGRGLFGIITPPGVDPIEPIEVESGDLHELFNPANLLDRPLHWATSTDESVDRISIAHQVPAIIDRL